MNTLAEQQQALLDALFSWPSQEASQRLSTYAEGVGASPQRGLKTYQSNGHMLAERALRAAFPVLAQMLGDASFADLARAFWHAHPPLRGDIAHWGQALADFVRGSAQLQDAPYLPDVALAEWALHDAATLPDRTADLGTLALLTSEDPQTLTLELAPGQTTLSSAWPLASLVLAHKVGQPTLVEVASHLHDRMAQEVVIWRAGWQPQLRLALPGEVILLRSLQAGVTLGPAVDASAALDFSQWLPLAVQTGLVLGVRRLLSDQQELPT
jgi:hypothetical protein